MISGRQTFCVAALMTMLAGCADFGSYVADAAINPPEVETVRFDYNFSTNVSWANLVQYDSESRILGVQSRFRWILKPGNDLFIVLNRGWYRREFDNRYLPSFDKGSVKLQYTFRL